MRNRYILLVLGALAFVSVAATQTDPYLWLEEVEGAQPLAWVKDRNDKSVKHLEADPRYSTIAAEVRKIALATDRVPSPDLKGEWVYNFWQDATNVRGLWRRQLLNDYSNPDAKWETVLDLDALAKTEKENWVWKGANCLAPAYTRCLLNLSRGGKDAVVTREFDVVTKTLVANGFHIPEAKARVDWRDENTLFVGSDFGPGSLTLSGYPRLVKVWKRGTPLSEAKTIYEAKETDMVAMGTTLVGADGSYSIVLNRPTFFETKAWLIKDDDTLVPIPTPTTANLVGIYRGKILATLRTDWTTPVRTLPAGALVALPIASMNESSAELVFAPNERSTVASVIPTKDALILTGLENVKGRIWQVSLENGLWTIVPLSFPDNHTISVVSSDRMLNTVLISAESFLNPSTIYSIDATLPKAAPKTLRQMPPRFDSAGMNVDQFHAKSKDGTMIPYFVVKKTSLKLDGKNPTLLYGYGGFEISQTPVYGASNGKTWLERGGVYVVANIRGGGEFGPKWHRAALTVNRQRAYDDFAAVAEDLVARKITSPRHLGIYGGSNGGLLVGVAFTQRPDLYHAVVCSVPLLDMLRYHKLLAGNSWIGEYGDPDQDAAAKAAILKYSPYQNLKPGVKYPKVFFTTSTKDDRVHPGHARKMVARMEELGHDLLYFENTEGGHGGAANIEQQIKVVALRMTYLMQELWP